MFGRNKTHSALPGSNASPVQANDIMERLAADYMKDRKWRRIFKFMVLGLALLYIISLFSLAGGGMSKVSKPHTALVELKGVIGGGDGVTADQINQSLRKAFENKLSTAVVMRINSPGGSPVQSAEINEEIVRLRALYPEKPMHVVISDVCASGGYFVAAAADQIYANRSSIVGSIGVRMDSFGFVGTLEKLGVERRSLTAGKNKSILDPFLPVVPAQQQHARGMLAIVHQQFIETVKAGRGDRLVEDPEIFSGLFWSGETAKKLGLIDAYGSLDYVAREVLGEEHVVDYSYRPDFFEQFSRNLGVSIGNSIATVFGTSLTLN